MSEIRERYADLEHARWARWQRYLHDQCRPLADGSLVIPPDLVARWERQIDTHYANLSEQEKDSDRKEVQEHVAEIERLTAELQGQRDGEAQEIVMLRAEIEAVREALVWPDGAMPAGGVATPSVAVEARLVIPEWQGRLRKAERERADALAAVEMWQREVSGRDRAYAEIVRLVNERVERAEAITMLTEEQQRHAETQRAFQSANLRILELEQQLSWFVNSIGCFTQTNKVP